MKRTNEYVRIEGWLDAEVKRECIMHRCRCCQYEWETAPQGPNAADDAQPKAVASGRLFEEPDGKSTNKNNPQNSAEMRLTKPAK